MRGVEDLRTAGDKRLTQNVGILRSNEHYWDISDTEGITLDIMETTGLQDKDKGEI